MVMGSCKTSPLRICDSSLELEVRARKEVLREFLNTSVDRVTKDAASSAECLFMLESVVDDSDSVARWFVMLTMPIYKPKFAVWSWCDVEAGSIDQVAARELRFPFVVNLAIATCKVTQAGQRLKDSTSNELAIAMARSAAHWRSVRLEYEIPDGESLLPSKVLGLMGEPFSSADAARKRGSPPVDAELRSLAKRPRGDAFAQGYRQAQQARDRRGNAHGAQQAQEAPLTIADMPGEDYVDGGGPFPDEVVEEALEYHVGALEEPDGDEVVVDAPAEACASSAEPPAPPPEPAPPPPPPPPPQPEELVGPNAGGYFKQGGRLVGRVSSWGPGNRNCAVKCYQHSNCTLAIAARQLPAVPRIKRWILDAELCMPGDTDAEKRRKGERHLAALRVLRDTPAG